MDNLRNRIAAGFGNSQEFPRDSLMHSGAHATAECCMCSCRQGEFRTVLTLSATIGCAVALHVMCTACVQGAVSLQRNLQEYLCAFKTKTCQVARNEAIRRAAAPAIAYLPFDSLRQSGQCNLAAGFSRICLRIAVKKLTTNEDLESTNSQNGRFGNILLDTKNSGTVDRAKYDEDAAIGGMQQRGKTGEPRGNLFGGGRYGRARLWVKGGLLTSVVTLAAWLVRPGARRQTTPWDRRARVRGKETSRAASLTDPVESLLRGCERERERETRLLLVPGQGNNSHNGSSSGCGQGEVKGKHASPRQPQEIFCGEAESCTWRKLDLQKFRLSTRVPISLTYRSWQQKGTRERSKSGPVRDVAAISASAATLVAFSYRCNPINSGALQADATIASDLVGAGQTPATEVRGLCESSGEENEIKRIEFRSLEGGGLGNAGRGGRGWGSSLGTATLSRSGDACGRQHISTCQEPHGKGEGEGVPGIDSGPPWWEASGLTTQPSWPHHKQASPVSLLTSHQGELGSIPGRITPPRFSRAGIAPDDAAGRRVFSGISRFPRPSIPGLLHTHFIDTTAYSQTRVCDCASKVKKRGSDTGDTNTTRLAPHRSYAQGVQCFRRDAVLYKSDLLSWSSKLSESTTYIKYCWVWWIVPRVILGGKPRVANEGSLEGRKKKYGLQMGEKEGGDEFLFACAS
ncbi:hypothetical protein PR048_032347 [Dryococelus australis]|uniref:Uncharacterized protein n=1 Tax=Dryococelus australis TaxID=614101 RepID=A0ABQ9G634_9NEOP|nr:hypothetical protein PR048_032347 [Dryococelus australis]